MYLVTWFPDELIN